MRYSPELDGLRGVSVLAVLLFHYCPRVCPGGFLGVDVFFVLSGYLITSVILHELDDGAFTLREFYLRRIQRLLPNAVLMIAATVVAAYLLWPASSAAATARHGVWAAFSLSNFFVLEISGNYWGPAAASMPLLHTWSLAVEEQFYLLFAPLVVVAHRRVLLSRLLGVAGLSLAVAFLWSLAHPAGAFYLLPTRAWQPLVGAALSAYLHRSPASLVPSWLDVLLSHRGWLGLGLIVASFALGGEGPSFPGLASLTAAAGALLVIGAVRLGEGPSDLLDATWLVWVGRLSYSLYLWHWPPLVLGRALGLQEDLGAWWPALAAALGVGLAVAAFYAVEEPLRQRAPYRALRLSLTALGFVCCVALCVFLSSAPALMPWEEKGPFDYFDRVRYRGREYSDRSGQGWASGGLIREWGGETPRVVVLGSSHAAMYGGMIDDVCHELGLTVSFLCADGKTAWLTASELDTARKRWIARWRPAVVFVIDRWEARGPPANFEKQLRDTLAYCEAHADRVVVFSQVPVLEYGTGECLRHYAQAVYRRTGRAPVVPEDAGKAARLERLALMERVCASFSRVKLLRAHEKFYGEDGSVRYRSGPTCFYLDTNHLADAGAALLRDDCLSLLADVE